MAGAISGEDSAFSVFHRQRNRIWLIARNVPSPLVFLVLTLQIAVIPLTVWRRGRGGWCATLRGVAAGVSGLPLAMRQRRAIQRTRILSNRELARMLVWEPAPGPSPRAAVHRYEANPGALTRKAG